MKSVVLLLILLLALAATMARAQALTECPTIQVTGPAGIVMPGEIGTFMVDIVGLPPGTKPKIEWTLNDGEIVSGQGTTTIQVRAPEATLTATVRVSVPEGCIGEASETMPYCRPIQNVRLTDLQPEDSINPADLNAVVEHLLEYKSSQLVILVGYKQGKPSDWITRRKELVRETLVAAGLDPDRITFRGVFAHRELMQFWRVPPGATDPTCDECEDEEKEASCPRISLNGPAGMIAHGMATTFSVNADLPNLENLGYEWSVTAGRIDRGQGKPHLYLITNNADAGKELREKFRLTEFRKDVLTLRNTYMVKYL